MRALGFEGADVVGGRAPGCVTGGRLQQRRTSACDGLLLKDFANGTRCESFLGEEVCGTHERAHGSAARGKRGSEHRDRARRFCIVNAASKDNTDVAERSLGEKPLDSDVP